MNERRGLLRARLAATALVALVAGAGPAAAQSERYPAPLPDKERELEDLSKLWESAVEPGRAPHAALLEDAHNLIKATGRTEANLRLAAAKAAQAIALRPKEPGGYLMRAVAQELLRQWTECASNYQMALDLDPKITVESELRASQNPVLGLGICLARSNKLAAAELVFERGVARTPNGVDEWLRLGETRVALGKLREGLEALQASTEASGDPASAINLWLRALAYDRGRQTAQADEAGAAAALADRYLAQLNNQITPFINDTERDNLLGLGSRYIGKLEVSLAYFRRVATADPGGMWSRRAREHVELLEQAHFPEEVRRGGGTAPLDIPTVRAMVRKAMPQLVACTTSVPTVAFEVRIIRSRPAATAPGPGLKPRPPGASATSSMVDQPEVAGIDQAQSCLQAAALKIDLPAVKDAGTWYEVVFSMISHRPTADHGQGTRRDAER